MPNVSIAVSAQDNYSTAIKSMSQVTRGFSKDAEDMQKKLDMLNKNKVSLKVEVDKARTELKSLEKQFAATGDEADGLKMQIANENSPQMGAVGLFYACYYQRNEATHTNNCTANTKPKVRVVGSARRI